MDPFGGKDDATGFTIAHLEDRGDHFEPTVLRPFIDLTITVIILTVTHFPGCWTTLPTSIERPFVDLAITIVVNAVANLLPGLTDTFATAAAADLTLTAEFTLVRATVAVVVYSIAGLDGHRATLAAGVEDPVVDVAVTVVILTIADLFWSRATPSAGVLHAFIDKTIAIVVQPIADLFEASLRGWVLCLRWFGRDTEANGNEGLDQMTDLTGLAVIINIAGLPLIHLDI